MGERRRETEKRERERRGSETDMPKLYTYNEYELSVTALLPRKTDLTQEFNIMYLQVNSFSFLRGYYFHSANFSLKIGLD